jgi:hypothetical protein
MTEEAFPAESLFPFTAWLFGLEEEPDDWLIPHFDQIHARGESPTASELLQACRNKKPEQFVSLSARDVGGVFRRCFGKLRNRS